MTKTPTAPATTLTRRTAIAGGLAAGSALAGGLLPGIPGVAADYPPTEGEMQGFLLFDRALPLPEDPFLDAQGAERRFSDFSGNVLLVNFWATWCAPCIHEMPGLVKLAERLSGEPFRFLAISQDRGGAETALSFARDRLNLREEQVFFDPRLSVGRGLRVRGLPTTFVIDAEGTAVGALEGAAEWDTPEALALIRHVLAHSGGETAT